MTERRFTPKKWPVR